MTVGDFFSLTRPSLFLVSGGHRWSVEEYLERAARVAAQLGASAAPVINLCEQRAAFLVAYMAALLSARTTLLPSSRAAEAASWSTTHLWLRLPRTAEANLVPLLWPRKSTPIL